MSTHWKKQIIELQSIFGHALDNGYTDICKRYQKKLNRFHEMWKDDTPFHAYHTGTYVVKAISHYDTHYYCKIYFGLGFIPQTRMQVYKDLKRVGYKKPDILKEIREDYGPCMRRWASIPGPLLWGEQED